jgi:hypothetical protein
MEPNSKKNEHMSILKPHLGYLGLYLPNIRVLLRLCTHLPRFSTCLHAYLVYLGLKPTYLLTYLVYLKLGTILDGMEGFSLRVRTFSLDCKLLETFGDIWG